MSPARGLVRSLALSALLGACASSAPPAAEPAPAAGTSAASPAPSAASLVPAARAAPGVPEGPSEPATATVVNPTSHAKLAVYLYTPDGAGPFPTLVVQEPVRVELRSARKRQPYLDAGLALVLYDPDGRGQSGGTDDNGGAIQQDGLKAVIDWAAAQPAVDHARMGMVSFSAGVMAATGTLARYPDTPIRFLIDWEGPSDRQSFGCDAGSPPGTQLPCADDAYWSQREARALIARVHVPYHRVQYQTDHHQPDHHCAVDMAQAALAAGNPDVRVNDGAAGAAVRSDADITPIPDGTPLPIVLTRYARAHFGMAAASPAGGPPGRGAHPRGPRRGYSP